MDGDVNISTYITYVCIVYIYIYIVFSFIHAHK